MSFGLKLRVLQCKLGQNLLVEIESFKARVESVHSFLPVVRFQQLINAVKITAVRFPCCRLRLYLFELNHLLIQLKNDLDEYFLLLRQHPSIDVVFSPAPGPATGLQTTSERRTSAPVVPSTFSSFICSFLFPGSWRLHSWWVFKLSLQMVLQLCLMQYFNVLHLQKAAQWSLQSSKTNWLRLDQTWILICWSFGWTRGSFYLLLMWRGELKQMVVIAIRKYIYIYHIQWQVFYSWWTFLSLVLQQVFSCFVGLW